MEPLVTISHLSKTYRPKDKPEVHALQDIDLTVHEGEFLSLIGSSGCGKSTLLRIIAGLDAGYDGTVEWRTHPEPGKDIGFVFQEPALLPWRSVRRNAQLGLELQGMPAPERDARVDQLLELVGLQDFARALPKELSGGMRQRLSIVRALAYDPQVLLMDEPFGALDQITRERLQDDLLRIWEETGKTIVLVTHGVDEATYLSDRVVVMSPRPGRVRTIHEVPLARPRSLQTKALPEYSRFQVQLREEL
jgi:NitT/TauT family transport system ATP-binding protein